MVNSRSHYHAVDFARVQSALWPIGASPGTACRQSTRRRQSGLADGWDEVTALPRPLRERLRARRAAPQAHGGGRAAPADGTIKLQLRTHDGYPLEAVAMRHGDRRTVCLSSQSGCALACTFCATGAMGLGRNLTPGEILEQLLVLARRCATADGARVATS